MISGCSAAWLARLTGGQKVGGSNPLTPTHESRLLARVYGFFVSWPNAKKRLLLLECYQFPRVPHGVGDLTSTKNRYGLPRSMAISLPIMRSQIAGDLGLRELVTTRKARPRLGAAHTVAYHMVLLPL